MHSCSVHSASARLLPLWTCGLGKPPQASGKTAVPRIGSTNHVLEDEHLLRDFRRRECAVLLGM